MRSLRRFVEYENSTNATLNKRLLGISTVLLFSLILIKTIFFQPKPALDVVADYKPTPVRDTVYLFGKPRPRDSVGFREDGHSDSMIVRVDSFSAWQEPKNTLFKLLPGFRYYTAFVTFKNEGRTPRHPIDFDCYLIDDQDSAHSPAIGAAHRDSAIALPDSLIRGASASGWLTFALRKKNTPISFEYEEIMNGQPVKIMLNARPQTP